jgi:peptide/nickel transport system substrate-binding protein
VDALPNFTNLSRRYFLQATAAFAVTSGFVGRANAASGGQIIWGKSIEATMLDPHTALVGSSWQLQFLVYETLTSMGDGFTVQPGLAESWETPSPTEYIFTLRKGVTFSNGRPMTVDDVVGSLRRVVDPSFGSWWAFMMGSVKEISAPDERTVKIELKEPFTPLLASLAASMAAILPMEELNAGSFDPSQTMMGTGPFMVAEHQQNDFWILSRNPHYWLEGAPAVDQVRVQIIGDDNARLAALANGAIDIANFENPDAPLLLSTVSNITVVEQETPDIYTLVLNAVWEKSPFRDERLRQAVFLALDREQIRNVALSGQGAVTSVAAVVFSDSCRAPGPTRDVARARELVAEAGGLSFEMLVQSSQAIQRIAQVVQQQLSEAGIELRLTVVDEGVFVDNVFVNATFAAAPLFWSAYADPGMVPALWAPTVSGFTGGYVAHDETLTRLIRSQLSTPTSTERTEMLTRICRMAEESAQMIPLVTKPVTIAFRSDRISAKINPDEGYNDTLRYIETFERL